MAEVSERRQVRVRDGDTEFSFLADPDAGRLVIREQRGEEDPEELCALTIADRDELAGFLTGLRRVLGVDAPTAARDETPVRAANVSAPSERRAEALTSGRERAPDPTSDSPNGADEEDRDAIIERARQRNPQAFSRWTSEEEQRLREEHEEGLPVEEIARRHDRSRRAVQMRLERLGLREPEA
jgi:hypothetical protein